MFCEYKNLFGKVEKSVHYYRIFNIAIIDVLLTIIGAFLINLFPLLTSLCEQNLTIFNDFFYIS